MFSYKLKNWQKVIFRNFGCVNNISLAKVLGCDEKTVIENAEKLGLGNINFNSDWLDKGFVTIIRNNWDLLTLEQISILLNVSLNELKKTLVEYDFLDIKLGEKPETESVNYLPLTNKEDACTVKIGDFIKSNFIDRKVKPFDFYSDFVAPKYFKPKNLLIKDSFTSSYSAKYSGALLDEQLADYSDDYLEKVAATGTSGIWISDTIRNLAEFPFDKSYSPDYKIRIKNLKKLTERCLKHGLDVYLYINEPRSLPDEFFVKHPHLRGQRADDGTYCLCTSQKEVIDYLYCAVKSIAENVPLLKAIMTITMSENPTHCYSRPWANSNKIETDCPRCIKRKPYEIVAEINNTIAKALKDGNGKTKLIANVWGWAKFNDKDGDVFDCIKLLDKDIEVLCVSEYKKSFVRGGVSCKVDDYSISVVGPSDLASDILKCAKENGHKIWAKVQLNNSWECSAVPFIPVFDLMLEHVKNLKALKVDGIMTGWSLGGYPGGALPLCNCACGDEVFDEKIWYEQTYEDNAALVKSVVEKFCNAFVEFPFSVDSLYFGGQNLGCGNLWSLKKQSRKSSMVCFTFDDCESWVNPYGVDKYIEQMRLLTEKWRNGLNLIENIEGNAAFTELVTYSKACYCHFISAYNLTRFSKYKSNIKGNKEQLLNCIALEEEATKMLYGLITKNSKVGFEMTNHYYYNENLLLEKLINLNEIKSEIL